MARKDPNQAAKAEAEVRRVKAFELRKAGASYRAIGAALGVSEATAHRDIHAVLKRLAKQQEGHAEEYRQLELERLDALIASVWSQARGDKKKNIPPDLAAMDRLMRLMQQRARLMGLELQAEDRKETEVVVRVVYGEGGK